jgi:hypothetical protein
MSHTQYPDYLIGVAQNLTVTVDIKSGIGQISYPYMAKIINNV